MVKNQDSPLSPRTINVTWLLPVINNQNAPPANPNDGDRYRVTATATGAWTGKENSIAIYDKDNLNWVFEQLQEAQVWYDFTSQNWHYMNHTQVLTQFDKIPLAESDVTGLVADLASKAPIIHKANHVSGGSDPFVAGDLLDATAKSIILKNGAVIATRRGINLIEGANISMTVADDGTDERANVTINASVGGNHSLLDGLVDQDTVATSVLRGMLIIGNSTSKWGGLPLGSNNQVVKSNGLDIVYDTIANILGYTPENPANKNVALGYSGLNASNQITSNLASKTQVPNLDESQITNLVSDLGNKMTLLASVSLGAAANSLSTGAFTAKKYLRVMILIKHNDSSSLGAGIQFNSDVGNNYSFRNSLDNQAPATGTQITSVPLSSTQANATIVEIISLDIVNIATWQKVIHGINFLVSSGATDDGLKVHVGGWWNNLVSQITSITLMQSTTPGQFAAGTEILVFGHD